MNNLDTLTNEQLEEITRVIIKIMQKREEEEREIKRDEYFRKIKKLLKYYRQLKSYSGNMQKTVKRFEDLQNAFGFGEVEFPVSLSKYENKTVIFMEYVDSSLDAYKKLCEEGTEEEQRRWKILYDMYLSKKSLTVEKICEKYKISKSTPYREVNVACETLKILLFGFDGTDGLFNLR